jgi:sugar phosphate isomerase/epimerase
MNDIERNTVQGNIVKRNRIRERVHVNIPFQMLYTSYLPIFVDRGINPEIGFDARSLDDCDRSHYAAVAERLQDGGLLTTVHAPFADLSPGSPDPGIWQWTRHRFERTLEAVSCLKPRTVVCHAGYDARRYHEGKAQWIEKSLEMWSWFAGKLCQEGCRLMIENAYEEDPQDIQPIFEGLSHLRVGFCLDMGHQAAFGKAALERWMDILGPHLGQVHLHDNHGGRDEHLALGKGTIDFVPLFRLLGSEGREPPVVTLEPHREEDLWPSLEFLERLWPW